VILDALHSITVWVLLWLAHHPLVVIIPFGWCWVLGIMLKAAKVTLRPLVGLLATLFAIGWLWKKRRDIGTGIVVVAVTVTVLGWLLAIWQSPSSFRVPLIILALGVLVFFLTPGDVLWPGQPGGWIHSKIGDSPLSEALREWAMSHQLHHQLVGELGVDAGVKRPKKVGGVWVAGADTVGDPTKVDPHAVGAKGNRVTTVRQVGVQPGDKLGSATITLSPEPPEPALTPWQRYFQLGPQPWPGPSTSSLDDPMRVLFDPWGRPLLIPVPGMTGNNMLVTGPTGGGKTGALHVIIADLAFRHDLAIIYLDPHNVEGGLWLDRCTLVAQGVPECVKAIAQLPRLMDSRARRMKGRSWDVRTDGPRALVIADEYAAIPSKAKDGMGRWLAEGRKFGGGSIVCLQRAERAFIELHQRDNCRVRVACGAESAEASRMTLGQEAPSATEIPESLKGGAIVRVERNYRPARFYLLSPPGPLPFGADPIELAAPVIARATSSLRIPIEDI
jgi:hypothetical protein